ncbi:uncharacterized protein LOC108107710 [Drosophila eugracilis]|uniref:uncharacterized protein LOC108107710 n=1 Tax=Drosophila eugracilis TaxID=29029 RepID=UPI0007E6B340|nr:uncharacterized protein LOC108107710 [Drosophila eugracilis]
MSQEIRRSERLRRLQRQRPTASLNARVLFILDSSPNSSHGRGASEGSRPHIQIISGPSQSNSTRFMPLNLSNPRSMVQSVLMAAPTASPRIPQRVRYTSIPQWTPSRRARIRAYEDPDNITGVLLMAIIVSPSMENFIRLNPNRAMSLILRIAFYFLY